MSREVGAEALQGEAWLSDMAKGGQSLRYPWAHWELWAGKNTRCFLSVLVAGSLRRSHPASNSMGLLLCACVSPFLSLAKTPSPDPGPTLTQENLISKSLP